MNTLAILLLITCSRLYDTVAGLEWRSEIIPVPKCSCRRWISTSNDTKWMNETSVSSKFLKKLGFNSCRYGVKIERKQCIESGKDDPNTKKCDKNEIFEERYFYLAKTKCASVYENEIFEEKCDSQCRRKYRKIFRPCYQKKKKKFLHCKVDWERCNTTYCERSPLQEYNVMIRKDCDQSVCSDGVSKGVIYYKTKCINVSVYGGNATGVPCSLLTHVTSPEMTIPCSNLPTCPTEQKIATTKRTSTSLPTLSAQEPTISNTWHTGEENVGIFTDIPAITTLRSSTMTDTKVKVKTRGSNVFFVVMIIVGSVLFLLVVGLIATICYVIVCKERKGRFTFHDMLRMSRDSLERGKR